MIDEKYAEQTPKYVQQTPKKKGHKKLLIILAVVLFAFIVFAIGAIAAGGSSTTDTAKPQQTTTAPAPKQQTPQPTQPQPQQQTPTVGQAYDAGNWQVTVNGTSIGQGNEFEQPKAGNQYLVVHVTLKNTSGQTQTASSMLMWALKDSAGQTYNETILTTAKASPDGKVADNGVLAGDLVYEVPTTVHNYTVQFTPDLGGDTLVEWNLSI
jgi:hypothetical protein